MTVITEENMFLAKRLFPGLARSESGGDPAYYEEKYPARDLPDGAAVTRLGPSPTGFIHLGNLYTAIVNQKLANETGGIFLLRVEDTDSKREMAGAVESLIASLSHYGVVFDEGVMLDALVGGVVEQGGYGPYHQSARRDIYHTFAKRLVEEGKAYPCFLTEEEIDGIRIRQEAAKLTPGIYGQWAKYRSLTAAEYGQMLERGLPYVLRFRAPQEERRISVRDGIRGEVHAPGNTMDFVLLKSDGMPTYHFAHVVDDHLMRTTHVIRGEEWLSSLPVHVDLFEALGFELPIYCHSAVLMKMDGEKKRKLSKRKDPELSLEYYRREGYHPQAVLEYLLTIINSNYEEWRAANPDAPIAAFEMTTEKMGVSGILFDLEKLRDVSRETLVRLPAEDLADFLVHWSGMYCEDAHRVLSADRERLARILDIGRAGDKPRKDLSYASQMWEFIRYFYEGFLVQEDPFPDNVPAQDIPVLLEGYLAEYAHTDDRDAWFGKIRALAELNGYAAKPKDFKREPDRYKGHVGDVSTVIRLALTGRASSPDLYEIQQILGDEETRRRVREAAATLSD